jgi:RNA polymerase sigma-70 factor (ECF subfamily)
MSVMGKFQLEAAIQSVHCARAKTGTIDWPAIRALYEGILALGPTLVAEINRAVTILHVNGAEAALSALDQISSDRITAYQPYWAARAHILEECGHRDDAITSCDRAIALKPDEAAKDFLRHRLQALG